MAFYDLGLLSHDKVSALAASQGAIGVVQTGALEAHGTHLPIANDTLYIARLVKDVAEEIPFSVVVCPPIMGGMSHRHRRFAGTVVLPGEAFKSSILAATRTMVKAGFKKIAYVSGHGGNFPPMRETQIAASALYPEATIRGFGGFGRSFSVTLEKVAKENGITLSGSEGHAGYWQTCLALHLFPELVGDYASVTGYVAGEPDWAKTLVSTGAHALHPTGVVGDPSRASAEMGRLGYLSIVREFSHWLTSAFNRPDDWRYRARDAATFDYLDPDDFVISE